MREGKEVKSLSVFCKNIFKTQKKHNAWLLWQPGTLQYDEQEIAKYKVFPRNRKK